MSRGRRPVNLTPDGGLGLWLLALIGLLLALLALPGGGR